MLSKPDEESHTDLDINVSIPIDNVEQTTKQFAIVKLFVC